MHFAADGASAFPILLLDGLQEPLLVGGGHFVAFLDAKVVFVKDLLDFLSSQRFVGTAQLILVDHVANEISQLLRERATQCLFTEGHGVSQCAKFDLLIIFPQYLLKGFVLGCTLCQLLAQ